MRKQPVENKSALAGDLEAAARLLALGIEQVDPPRLWLRCRICGAIWTPHMRRQGRQLVCPNECNIAALSGS